MPTPAEHTYDLLITNAHLIDPASGLDGPGHLAIKDGMIAAVSRTPLPGRARREIDAGGRLVCPGLIDLHVHVYEWTTNFGVCADDAGIHAGATTVVDQGSSGAWTFGGFRAHVIEPSLTDVRAFVSVNVAGALMGGMKGDVLHNPTMLDHDSTLAVINNNPQHVKGIKCHAESGGLSHWGTEVLESAARLGREADVPLYMHTGELFPVNERDRPAAGSILKAILPLLKPGDVLAHIYSSKPDGIIGERDSVPTVVRELLARGVHFDIGYGINFSYRIARMLMAEGIYPYTISSDVHGDFNAFHDDSRLDYSLYGAMTRLLALGMPLTDIIRATTLNPATVLRETDRIGTLAVGSRADLALIDRVEGAWHLHDGRGAKLTVSERLLPWMTVRQGTPHIPHRRLLPDLLTPQRVA